MTDLNLEEIEQSVNEYFQAGDFENAAILCELTGEYHLANENVQDAIENFRLAGEYNLRANNLYNAMYYYREAADLGDTYSMRILCSSEKEYKKITNMSLDEIEYYKPDCFKGEYAPPALQSLFFYITAAEKGSTSGYRKAIHRLGYKGGSKNLEKAEELTFESINLGTKLHSLIITEFSQICRNYEGHNYEEYNSKGKYLNDRMKYFYENYKYLTEDEKRIELQKVILDYNKKFDTNVPSNFQSK